MGGFSNVFGHVAAGYEGARQQDLERQFTAEQNRRSQLGGFLQKIAGDETAHPYSRQQAINEYLKLGQTPWNKPYKFNPDVLVAPPEQQTPVSMTPPPSAPLQVGNITLPQPPPSQVSLQSQPGVFMSPEQRTQMMAQRVGQVTGAEAGAAAKFPVLRQNPQTGEWEQVFASGTGNQIGQTFEGAFNPAMMRGMLGMIHPVVIEDPQTHLPIPALQNKMTGEVYDQSGMPIQGAVAYSPALLGRTGKERMDVSGAITRETTPSPRGGVGITPSTVTGPAARGMGRGMLGFGAAPQISMPPAPPLSQQLGVAPEMVPPEMTETERVQPKATFVKPTRKGIPAGAGTLVQGGTAAPGFKGGSRLPVTPADFQAIKDPVTREAYDWAMLGKEPKGPVMAVRQVESKMNQLGLAKALPVPPVLQQKIQQQFVARNSAINIIDDIMANKQVFQSLLSQGKISIATNEEGSGVMQQIAGLNDQEARVAGDFKMLIEHANLLRGPLGATGFRGKEAWDALQAQRGKPLGDPRITVQTLQGMRDRLVGLNSADRMVLEGKGMQGAAADPYEGRTAVGANGHEIKWTGGKWVDSVTGEAVK